MEPLFPDEVRPGVSLSQERIKSLSGIYSRLYPPVIAACGGVLGDRFGLSPRARETLARETIVPLTHAFLDRLLRLSLRAARGPAPPLARGREERAADMAAFRTLAQSSYAYNQALLCRLAPLLDLKLSDSELPAIPAPAMARPFFNHNFTVASPGRRILRKIAAAGRRLLRRSALRGRLPSLSMGYSTQPLKDAGFYDGLLVNIQRQASLGGAADDPGLRRMLAQALKLCGPALEAFLREAGGIPSVPTGVTEAWAEFASSAAPASMLEAVPANMAACRAVLAPYGTPLLIGETNTLEPTFMMAAAQELGLKVIGFQHGGHYGFMDDHTHSLETEYGAYDRFVTWGWEPMPDHPNCRGTQAVALPVPWLSERRRYWTRARSEPAADAADFLLMPNQIYRFPPAPSGAAVSRSDRLADHCRVLEGLIAAAARRGLTTAIKPFDRRMVEFMPRTFDTLRTAGGAAYRRLDILDKGLHPALLRLGRVLVWDQAGDGLLECLACGIPTLVLWPRHYCREDDRAAPLVAGLERTGIIHREPQSLLDAYQRYRSDPRAWLDDSARAEAVGRFLRRYAWIDDRWERPWRDFLESL